MEKSETMKGNKSRKFENFFSHNFTWRILFQLWWPFLKKAATISIADAPFIVYLSNARALFHRAKYCFYFFHIQFSAVVLYGRLFFYRALISVCIIIFCWYYSRVIKFLLDRPVTPSLVFFTHYVTLCNIWSSLTSWCWHFIQSKKKFSTRMNKSTKYA